jgi:hypothetical protein
MMRKCWLEGAGCRKWKETYGTKVFLYPLEYILKARLAGDDILSKARLKLPLN